MEEVATCECGNQKWEIYDNRVRCSKCGREYFAACVDIVKYVNKERCNHTEPPVIIHQVPPIIHPVEQPVIIYPVIKFETQDENTYCRCRSCVPYVALTDEVRCQLCGKIIECNITIGSTGE